MPDNLSNKGLSRRNFVSSSASFARGSLLVLSMPALMTACREANEAILSAAEFQILTEEEANEYAAMAARIIPTDKTPGATEAGVIYFIDSVLGDASREEMRSELQSGMLQMQTEAALDFGASYFHQLTEVQQDELLTKIEETPFFNTIRYLTIAGMFSLPEYGGNRDGVGFQVIGMENRGAWAPPFGAYDADFMERGE